MAYKHEIQDATSGKYWNLPEIKMSGLVLHSVGCPQPKASVFVRNFNSPNARASVHGFIEPGLFIETAPCSRKKGKGKKCYHVGSGSKGSYNSSRFGIEMTEPSTIKYTGGASFKDLNPEKTRAHIVGVTQTAAEVFADLCIFHGFSVDQITTHRQAHLAGYGGNHGDPDHIWKHIGYSLEQFRKDVQYLINEKKGDVLANMTKEEMMQIVKSAIQEAQPETYKTIKEVPDYAKESVQKCIDLGIISGTGGETEGRANLNLSYDLTRTLVILDRAGCFDKAAETATSSRAKKARGED